MVMPSKVAAETMAAAVRTPNEITNVARQKGTPKINAAITPDHAPVKGSGMATKTKRAAGAQTQ